MSQKPIAILVLVGALSSCAGTQIGPTQLTYNPSSYQELEDNLDDLQDAKMLLLQSPDEFFQGHPEASGLSQSEVLDIITKEIRATMKLKGDVSGSGAVGGAGG